MRRRMQHELTEAQCRLVKRHERALLRLADELVRRSGFDASSMAFVLADARGRTGGALRAAMPLATIGPVVLPGRAAQLHSWVEQIARFTPVWDFQGRADGLVVIVVDQNDAAAVTSIERMPIY